MDDFSNWPEEKLRLYRVCGCGYNPKESRWNVWGQSSRCVDNAGLADARDCMSSPTFSCGHLFAEALLMVSCCL